MNIWEHSLLSAHKFGGNPGDYFRIHKFLDASRLFYYHFKHQALLHNTYGMDLCTRLFGDCIVNADEVIVLVSDIAAAHCREDLSGRVPTLNDWFKDNTGLEARLMTIPRFESEDLNAFILEPYILSGTEAALIISCTNFGSYLCGLLFDKKTALQHANKAVNNPDVKDILSDFKTIEPWQYTANEEDLLLLKKLQNAG